MVQNFNIFPSFSEISKEFTNKVKIVTALNNREYEVLNRPFITWSSRESVRIKLAFGVLDY